MARGCSSARQSASLARKKPGVQIPSPPQGFSEVLTRQGAYEGEGRHPDGPEVIEAARRKAGERNPSSEEPRRLLGSRCGSVDGLPRFVLGGTTPDAAAGHEKEVIKDDPR